MRPKTFNVCKRLEIYQLIWFKVDMIKDDIKVYILIQILLTLTFIQGLRSSRKQHFLGQLSRDVLRSF